MRHLSPFKDIVAIASAGSIRKASEILCISSTALNRRLLAIEEDFGVLIFERLPKGLRLSPAGELILQHMQNQISAHKHLCSRLDDLSGLRSGHISISCSQALLPNFLPEQVSSFRKLYPDVTFRVLLRDREAAEIALQENFADLSIVLEPVSLSVFNDVFSVHQPITCLMSETHPLAAQQVIRLSDLAHYPVAMPEAKYGVRYLIDRALMRNSSSVNTVIEADSFEFLRGLGSKENLITFHIPISLPQHPDKGLVYRPLDPIEVEPGRLSVGYLRGRSLPVIAERFLEKICEALAERFG